MSGKPAMALGIVGAPVGEYVAVEGRFGFGVRGNLSAGENFNLYGILGYGSGKAEVSTNFGLSDSASESSEAYGVGAEFVFSANKEHHLGFEWAKYFEDTNAISAIYRYRF